MTKINTILLWILLSLVLTFPALASEKFTDDDLRKFLEEHGSLSSQSHSIMAQEQQRMSLLLAAFMKTDIQALNDESRRLVSAISTVVNNYEPTSGKDAAMAWQITAAIVNEAYLMRDNIQQNNYKAAYTHFSRLGGFCVQCHEAVRPWGKFGSLKPNILENISVEKET